MSEKITAEDIERARKNKHSIMTNVAKLDVWTKFKVHCVQKGISVREGLRNAIREYMKHE